MELKALFYWPPISVGVKHVQVNCFYNNFSAKSLF